MGSFGGWTRRRCRQPRVSPMVPIGMPACKAARKTGRTESLKLLSCCALFAFTTAIGIAGQSTPTSNGTAAGAGRRAGAFTSLYSFKGAPDGQVPLAGLLLFDGALYGTTEWGGNKGCSAYGCGTVFKVTMTGKETILHRFTAGPDGEYPFGGLTEIGGMLYGTTHDGGIGAGRVFGITRSGKIRTIYDFRGGSDGALPTGTLFNVGGALYGTTVSDGAGGNCGTVFKVLAQAAAVGTERPLYGFKGGSDGCNPLNTPLIELNGTLYGTTYVGGAQGTVFSVTPSGTEAILHRFGGGSDGINPIAGLVALNGTLFGTTYHGGANGPNGGGIVFAITPTGTETVLHSFGTGSDGAEPDAGLVAVNDTLYGTTAAGGTSGKGTIFKITPSGVETVLHSFTGADGAEPVANLIDVKGTLYGTTAIGGSSNDGTIFSIAL